MRCLVHARPLAGAVLAAVVALAIAAGTAAADNTTVNGQGSTYVGLAMQQWVASAQIQGIPVNYTATSSPAGLTSFAQDQADFAGTEAEFASLGESSDVERGYQYTPDVAGATAIMYHVETASGQVVNYLHLSPATIAKIFTGVITNWDSPAISADNHGLQLPNEPIKLVARSGQSGTTALFYDFVNQTDPTDYANFLRLNALTPPNNSRLIEVDDGNTGTAFSNELEPFSGSDQEAEFVASPEGLWSIGYDEFAYPKEYNVPVAWVENASGNWTQPYATNIAAALQSAQLNTDLSQNLDNVYTSTNPATYPISAYSYIVTQCATTSSWPTCAGPYSNSGTAQTLGDFMKYVACSGQVSMAKLGYSPLPPGLAQDMENAVARMNGDPVSSATQVSSSNCSDPTLVGSLGAGATNPTTDPYIGCGANALAPGGAGCNGNGASTTTTSTTGTTTKGTTTTKTTTTKGKGGTTKPTKGGTKAPTKGSVGGGVSTSTSAPAAELGSADLGTPVSALTKAGAALTLSATQGVATAKITVPADALPAGSTVSVYPVTVATPVQKILPTGGWTYVTAFVVAWKDPAGAVPVASHPIAVTITDGGIATGGKLYDATSASDTAVGTASAPGTITGSFTSDPLLFVTQPARTTAPLTSSSGVSPVSTVSPGSTGSSISTAPLVSAGAGVTVAGVSTSSTTGTPVAFRHAEPVAYIGPGVPGPSPWPLIVGALALAALLALTFGVNIRRRRAVRRTTEQGR